MPSNDPAWVEKFRPRYTSDECYTPPAVYEAVRQWVDRHLMPLAGVDIRRPFRPGGDYEAEDYPPGCVVLDNPPFSCLSDIRRWYAARGVRYFLFAPALSLRAVPGVDDTLVITGGRVTFSGGAAIRVSFVTNLTGGDPRLMVAGSLHEALAEVERRAPEGAPRKKLPALALPPEVATSARLQRIATHGVDLSISRAASRPVKGGEVCGRPLFGGAFLLSSAAAAEKAAAERAAAEKAAERELTRLELTSEGRRLLAELDKLAARRG